VIRTRVGYAGGSSEDPTYHRIGDHSETIQIDFDPERITYTELLDIFWSAHNPRTPSFSRQYRSAIFVHDERQRRFAEQTKKREETKGKIYTEITALARFYPAEDYHQKYYLRGVERLMGELKALYPREEDFRDSTTAARLNGYVGGFGTLEQLEREIQSFGLSERAGQYLRERVSRRQR